MLLHGGEEGVEVEVGYGPIGGPRTHDDLLPLHADRITEHMFVGKRTDTTGIVATLLGRKAGPLAMLFRWVCRTYTDRTAGRHVCRVRPYPKPRRATLTATLS